MHGEEGEQDLFKATHFLYLSAQGWLNWFNQDGDKMRKAADSAALQERGLALPMGLDGKREMTPVHVTSSSGF